jgi:hypothetical protein
MTLNDQFRRNVRLFYAWLASMVLMGGSPLLALWLIDRGSLASRLTAVVVGSLGPIPWMWFIVSIIRRGDEFQRRMHLVAVAIAAVAGVIILAALNWLERAGFVGRPDLFLVWTGFLVLWVIALLATKRYYEREQ